MPNFFKDNPPPKKKSKKQNKTKRKINIAFMKVVIIIKNSISVYLLGTKVHLSDIMINAVKKN